MIVFCIYHAEQFILNIEISEAISPILGEELLLYLSLNLLYFIN